MNTKEERELLVAFMAWLKPHKIKVYPDDESFFVDEFLKSLKVKQQITAKEFYDQENKKGNTVHICGNNSPDYDLAFYRQIFSLMTEYAKLNIHNVINQVCKCGFARTKNKYDATRCGNCGKKLPGQTCR